MIRHSTITSTDTDVILSRVSVYIIECTRINDSSMLMLEYTYSKAIESPTHGSEITISLVDVEACIDASMYSTQLISIEVLYSIRLQVHRVDIVTDMPIQDSQDYQESQYPFL